MGIESIKAWSKRIKSVKVSDMLGYAYDDSEFLEELEGYNQSMLSDGGLSNGNVLPKYSIASQNLFGKLNIRIQLKDTGAFYESIKAKRKGANEIEFSGKTQKPGVDLEKKYTKHIFGTAPISEKDINELAWGFIVDGIKEKVNGK